MPYPDLPTTPASAPRIAITLALLTGCPGDGTDTETGATTEAAGSTTESDPTTGATTMTTGVDPSSSGEASTASADSTTGGDDVDTTSDGGATTTASGTTAGDCVGPVDAPTFSGNVYPIITANCECHTEGAPSGLAMPDAPTAYANLVDVFAVIPQMLFVDPGDHENSYLFHKLNGTWKEVGGAGDQMPLSGVSLDPADLQTIADWIDGCALP